MKRMNGILMVVAVLAVVILGCSSDGKSELKSIMNDQADITEKYVNGLMSAQNAQDVVAVIDEYTQGMKKLIPEIKALSEKYPEMQQGEVPEGMEEEVKRIEQITAKLPEAMMKVTGYMRNPEVQQAMMRMGQEMQKLQ